MNFSITEESKEYGLCVVIKSKSGKMERQVYKSLSKSKNDVEAFISLLVRNNVSSAHIEEIVDDYFFSY